jgi:hypothetical protein
VTDRWTDLLEVIDLRPHDGGFEGRNQRLGYHRVFGGQLLAQFVRAASLHCPGKAVKSLHAQFPRAGLTDDVARVHRQPRGQRRSLRVRGAPGDPHDPGPPPPDPDPELTTAAQDPTHR